MLFRSFLMLSNNLHKQHKYLQDYTKSIGAAARSGKPFSIQTIARMLRNDFYIGVLRYNAQGHEPIVVYDIIPPIIDKMLWDRVQQRQKLCETS